MKQNKIVEVAAVIVIGMVAIPLVSVAIPLVSSIGSVIVGGVKTHQYNRKIKKGLKEGTIVEINGQYYEARIEQTEEEA